ncbi:MAG: hypothetical protein MUF83_17110 [Acidimicrobiales bacterium]|nr:hypothetical protein [Acidimicrobiales bacterium]
MSPLEAARRAELETVLDAGRLPHLGIWRDEHDELTRAFFAWDVPELPGHVRAAVAAGVRDDVVAMGLDTVTDLLETGDLPLETGIARAPDGGFCVAVRTVFPGATPEMLDWWMGWHLARTERYKLWHPQAHLFSQARRDLSDEPGLTDRERYVDNTAWVDEYVGPIPTRLAITFHDPGRIGLPYDVLERSGHGTAICAVVADSDHGHELSRLVHAVRRHPWGSEMRSRFFFAPGTPELIAAPMLDHCWTEMTHLASFLPHLYVRVTAPSGSR